MFFGTHTIERATQSTTSGESLNSWILHNFQKVFMGPGPGEEGWCTLALWHYCDHWGIIAVVTGGGGIARHWQLRAGPEPWQVIDLWDKNDLRHKSQGPLGFRKGVYCLLPHKTLYIYFYFNNKNVFLDKHTVQFSFEYKLSSSVGAHQVWTRWI